MPRKIWTADRRRRFLEALREEGHIADAAAVVGMSRTSAMALRRRDKTFAQAWDEIDAARLDDLRSAVMRRARSGEEKPVFYGGKTIGAVRTPSDQLAMFLLREPENAGVNIDPADSPRAEIEQRLTQIEENIAAGVREDGHVGDD